MVTVLWIIAFDRVQVVTDMYPQLCRASSNEKQGSVTALLEGCVETSSSHSRLTEWGCCTLSCVSCPATQDRNNVWLRNNSKKIQIVLLNMQGFKISGRIKRADWLKQNSVIWLATVYYYGSLVPESMGSLVLGSPAIRSVVTQGPKSYNYNYIFKILLTFLSKSNTTTCN